MAESRRAARRNRKLKKREGPSAPATPPAPAQREPRKPIVFDKVTCAAPPPPRVHGLAKLITNISTAYWLLSVAHAGGSTAQLLHRRARERGSGWIADPLLERTLRELVKGRFLRRDRSPSEVYYILTAEGECLLEEMWDMRYGMTWTDPEDVHGYTYE